MASKNKSKAVASTTIAEFTGKTGYRYRNFPIGLEVELEGGVHFIEETQYWQSKEDGSLRHGVEYVLSHPIKLDQFDEALDQFCSNIKTMHPAKSLRTSTHFHINVLTKTIAQVYAFIVAYYLVEELLVRTQSKERQGNLFCLRMSDAQTIYHLLKTSLSKKTYFYEFREDMAKYSALNLCTVTRFGSVEFRFLEAMWDKESLKRWGILFYDLVQAGSSLTVSQVLKMYDDMPVKQFLSILFPNSPWIYAGFQPGDLNEILHTNYDTLKTFSRDWRRNSGFTLPYHLWDEDADVDEDGLYINEIEPGVVLTPDAFADMPTPADPPDDWNWDSSEP